MAKDPVPVNMAPIERAARVAVGLGVLSLTAVGPRTPWALLGLIPLVTGATGFCPLYHFTDAKGLPDWP